MEFERSARVKVRNLPLTALIDVMFILVIFFMLTTTFMRIESLELMLPSTSKTATKQEAMHLFIDGDGKMMLGQRRVDQAELAESLARMFEKDPATSIMMLTADGVTMQQLVDVMDRVYMAGGRSLFVRKWDKPPARETKP